MARQKGNSKMIGTIDGKNYYKSKGKYYVRMEKDISRERRLHDPAFKKTRENANEFGQASSDGKLLREMVKHLVKDAGEREIAASLFKILVKIKKLDTKSKRGEKNISTALALPEARNLLIGFEFNPRALTRRILSAQYFVDSLTGDITIKDLVPKRHIRFPEYASHVSVQGVYVDVNFATEEKKITYSNEVNLAKDSPAASVILTPTAMPKVNGVKIYFLHLKFFELWNGIQKSLNDGFRDTLVIAEVVAADESLRGTKVKRKKKGKLNGKKRVTKKGLPKAFSKVKKTLEKKFTAKGKRKDGVNGKAKTKRRK